MQYEELCFSWEYDPPIEDLIQDLLARIAQLLVLTININSSQDAPAVAIADYLTTWGERFPDDDDGGDDAIADVADSVAAARAAQDALRAALPVARTARLVGPMARNPRVRPVPTHIFAALTGENPH